MNYIYFYTIGDIKNSSGTVRQWRKHQEAEGLEDQIGDIRRGFVSVVSEVKDLSLL